MTNGFNKTVINLGSGLTVNLDGYHDIFDAEIFGRHNERAHWLACKLFEGPSTLQKLHDNWSEPLEDMAHWQGPIPEKPSFGALEDIMGYLAQNIIATRDGVCWVFNEALINRSDN